MKRAAAIFLTLVISVLAVAASASSGWYCPQCGRYNEETFLYCPKDGTRNPFMQENSGQVNSGSSVSPGGNYTRYASVTAVSNQRIATRTGPGTQYDEPGSFYKAGTSVKVVSKAYDADNGIWWVQVELTYQGTPMWVYTGLKRIDNLNLDSIPEEYVIGRCRTSMRLTGKYGPGPRFATIKAAVPAGVECDIYGYAYVESGDYIQIEFYDKSAGCYRRAWVQDAMVDDYEMYYGF